MSFPPIPSILRVGKVVQVNRYDHSVDIVFDDGALARNVPVMTGWGGSTFGFAGLAAPSFWSSQPRWPEKTYPRPGNTEATGDVTRTAPRDSEGQPLPAKLIQPTTNLDEELPDGTILEKEGRDIYAVVAPIEGSVSGAVGLVVLGFVYPMVAEMLFPPGDENQFADLTLVRHPSDVQITLDQHGKLSIQHPSGGQVILDYVPEGESTEPVDLTGQDYDGRYTLRNNTPASIPTEGRKPQLLFRIPHWTVEGNEAKQDGEVLILFKNTGGLEVRAVWGEQNNKGTITVVAGEAVTVTAGAIFLN